MRQAVLSAAGQSLQGLPRPKDLDGAVAVSNPTLTLTAQGTKSLEMTIGVLTDLVGRTSLLHNVDAQPPARPSCTISLSKHLPPPCYDCDVQCLQVIPRSVVSWWPLALLPWQDFRLAFYVPPAQLHGNTLAALSICSPIQEMPHGAPLHVFTDGSAKDDAAGWAVSLIQWDPNNACVSVLGAFGGKVVLQNDTADFVGAVAADARNAELTALVWAILWLLAHWRALLLTEATLNFDSVTAGFAASGDWQAGADLPSRKARHLAQALEAYVGPGRIHWHHVKAHSGQPWNELSDSIAGLFCAGTPFDVCTPRLPDLTRVGTDDTSSLHLLANLRDSQAMPSLREGVINWSPQHMGLTVLQPSDIIPFQVEAQELSWVLSCRCLTVNVQSAVGKCPFLEQQLESFGIAIAFLQETKMEGGLVRSSRFHRYASDACQHWGTAVWVSRVHPIGWRGKLPVFLDEAELCVTASGPRHIVLQGRVHGERLCLASIHYPQQGRPIAEWETLQSILDPVWEAAAQCITIIGCDVNGRPPPAFGQVTGDKVVGSPDAAGHLFCEALHARGWWTPSTFSDCHTGSDCTHVHPSGKESRIDFFAVSSFFRCPDVCTWVDKSFDLLNLQDDHFALLLEVRKIVGAHRTEDVKCRRRRFAVDKLKDPHVCSRISHRLESLPLPPWEMDVNAHAQVFQNSVHQILQEEIPWEPHRPTSKYLSDHTWWLRQQKQDLKGRTANRRRDHRPALLSCALDLWSAPAAADFEHCSLMLRKMCLLYELVASAIKFATGRLKILIRADKADHLKSVCMSIGKCDSQQIMSRLRSLQLGRRKPKSWKRQLPGLLTCHGAPVTDRNETDRLWLDFFGNMEAGEILPAGQFLQEEAAVRPPPEVDILPDALPSLLELEQGLRQVKPRKAAGLDDIPGDVLRALPKPFARLLYPLIAKSVLFVRQPVQWRGGTLFAAYKGSGCTKNAANYRSLFVSSAAGKVYHRLVRQRLVPYACEHLGSCHLGAKPGSPVTHGSHLVLSHELYCRRTKQSSAVLFLDTKQAYYRVVREAISGLHQGQDLDDCVLTVLRHFGMGPETWHALLALVQQGGAMRSADQEEGLTDPIVHDAEPSPWTSPPTGELWLTDATWADDTAFLTRAHSPDLLLCRAKHLATRVFDIAKTHALEPNTKKGKTELMVSLRGKGCRRTALAWLSKGEACIPLHTSTAGEVRLSVTADYVHLGFHLDRGATFGPEALRRLSQAQSSFKELRQIVFQNRHIPRPCRVQLFDALVDSTYFNLELWQEDAGPAWTKLVHGHSRMQRALLAREMPAEAIMKLTPADVTFILGSPPLLTLLRCKRLRYLATLVRAAPAELWAILKLEQGWLNKLLEDLRWLVTFAPGPWPEVDASTWPLWWHAIQDSPGRYKRQIAAASRRSTLATLWQDFASEAAKAMGEVALAFGRNVRRKHAVSCSQAFYCAPCRKPFASSSNLMCHLRHCHDRHADYLHYAGGVVCPGCGANYHSMGRILKHLKTVPTCWEMVRVCGQVADDAHHGEGSRVRNADKSANPTLVPAIPACGPRILYDDADVRALLPREKLVLRCASVLGGAIADWVESCPADPVDATLEQALWSVLCRSLSTFPLLTHEFRQAILGACSDIEELQDNVLKWPRPLYEVVVQHLQQWQTIISAEMIVMCLNGQQEAPLGNLTADAHFPVKPQEPFLFHDGGLVVIIGDPLPAEEMTRLLSLLQRNGQEVFVCGWDLIRFHAINLHRATAFCLHMLRSWEAKDDQHAVPCPFQHEWRSFALEAWSEDTLYTRASACRIAFAALKTIWKMVLLGRSICLCSHADAHAFRASSPIQRLFGHGSWARWQSAGVQWEVVARTGDETSLKDAWALHAC